MSERTPEQIIGKDAYTQLIFEGYKVVKDTPPNNEALEALGDLYKFALWGCLKEEMPEVRELESKVRQALQAAETSHK